MEIHLMDDYNTSLMYRKMKFIVTI